MRPESPKRAPKEAPPKAPKKDHVLFYGRRRGRKLRPQAAEYLEKGLTAWGLPLAMADAPPESVAPAALFAHRPGDIFLEIGFGGGEHLAARAAANPGCGFIGAEPFINGVAALCGHICTGGLENIRIWPEDVRLLLPCFAGGGFAGGGFAGGFAGAFILFPDPWPKPRHRPRRILQPPLIAALRRLIRPGGSLLLASDDPVAKGWILHAMVNAEGFRWQAASPRDWREPPGDWPPESFWPGSDSPQSGSPESKCPESAYPESRWHGTRYMAKAERAGRIPSWFAFRRED